MRTLLFSLTFTLITIKLGDHGRSSSRLVFPVSRKLSGYSVVPGETVDTALDQNKTELRVLVLTVSLQVLSDLNSLLDQHVQILWDFGCKSVGLEDTNDLLSGNRADLGDTVRVTKNNTDLGGGKSFLGKLADVVLNVGGGDFEPGRRCALVRPGGLRNTFSGCMQTSHLCKQA